MKKKLISCLAAIFFSYCCFSQAKVEKFCEITINTFRHVSLDFGNDHAYIRDSAIRAELNMVTGFNNTVDILNYMTRLGWTLVSSSATDRRKVFYFKKLFDNSVFTIGNNTN